LDDNVVEGVVWYGWCMVYGLLQTRPHTHTTCERETVKEGMRERERCADMASLELELELELDRPQMK